MKALHLISRLATKQNCAELSDLFSIQLHFKCIGDKYLFLNGDFASVNRYCWTHLMFLVMSRAELHHCALLMTYDFSTVQSFIFFHFTFSTSCSVVLALFSQLF